MSRKNFASYENKKDLQEGKEMKKKKLTRLLALMMSSVMLFSTAACSNSSQESGSETAQGTTADQGGTEENGVSGQEPVTLRIFMYDKSTPDDAAVAEYVNSLPQVQALNVQIEIVKQPGGGSEHMEKIPLLLATDEQMDIGFDASNNFTGRVQQGAYADISEFLANDPDFYNSIPEGLWEGVTYEGGIYAVPTYKDYMEQWAFFTDSYILEKYDIDPSTITDFQDMEVILEAEKQEGDRASLMFTGSMWGQILMTGLLDKYDHINSLRYAYMDPEEGKTVLNPFKTEEFAQLVQTMYDWNQKGYIHPDALTAENAEESFRTGGLKEGTSLISTGGIDYVLDASLLADYGWEGVTTLPVTGDPVITNSSTRGSLFGIYEKCENKELAYEFLKLWNTDPEVKNALYLGIPDQHYTVVDGKAQRVDNWDELYHSRNWTTGNNVIAMLTVDEEDGKWEAYQDAAETAGESADLGMILNADAIADKQAVIESVLAEYMPPLMLGFVEPESGIQQLNEQLEIAGIDEVLAEIQSQYDTFLASK